LITRRLCAALLLSAMFVACPRSVIPAKAGAQVGATDRTVTLVAVGDILLDRGVGRRIARFGPAYPFAKVADQLRRADIAFGNLECPISRDGVPVPKPFSFRADPDAARGVAPAGLDVVSLANNHALDCSRSGLTDTMAFLRGEGIAWCGAGRNRNAALAPTVIERKGVRVAFVGFCDIVQDASFPRDDVPCVMGAAPADVRRSVRAAVAQADVVVASFHWGIEYYTRPTKRQRDLAACAAQAGADVILGHHPHVLQGLQWLKGRQGRRAVVAYSLGNFVFDPLRSPAQRTMMLSVRLDRRGLCGVGITPCVIEECRPRPASGAEADAIVDRVAQLSAERGLRLTRGRATAR